MNEIHHLILRSESFYAPCSVFEHASYQIIRYANVENGPHFIGEDIDVVLLVAYGHKRMRRNGKGEGRRKAKGKGRSFDYASLHSG